MSYIDKAKEQLTEIVGWVIEAVSTGGKTETVTISRPRAEVEQFWRDPEKLSAVLGDIAEVRSTEPAHYEWKLRRGDDELATWSSDLVEGEGSLRFVGTMGDGSRTGEGPQIQLTFRDAPHNLGTEVTLQAKTPIPDVLTGAAAFKVLYRARALLQTGEIPTREHNPSRMAAH